MCNMQHRLSARQMAERFYFPDTNAMDFGHKMVISESRIYHVTCMCWERPDAKPARTGGTRFWSSRGCS